MSFVPKQVQRVLVTDIQSELTPELCLQIAQATGEDGELLSGMWYIGVILSILSSIASNLGVNVQKVTIVWHSS